MTQQKGIADSKRGSRAFHTRVGDFPGARHKALYERILRGIDTIERFAGPSYRGFQNGELWCLLEEPGSPSFPSHIPANSWHDAVARMLDPGKTIHDDEDRKRAEQLRDELRLRGYCPIDVGARSKKQHEDYVQNLRKWGHIIPVPGKRYVGNPVQRIARIFPDQERPYRRLRLVDGTDLQDRLALNLRHDLIADEKELLDLAGDVMGILGDWISFIQSADKTELDDPSRPNRVQPWGKPLSGLDAEYALLLHGYGRTARPPGWEADPENHRRAIRAALPALREALGKLTRGGDTAEWIEDEAMAG